MVLYPRPRRGATNAGATGPLRKRPSVAGAPTPSCYDRLYTEQAAPLSSLHNSHPAAPRQVTSSGPAEDGREPNPAGVGANRMLESLDALAGNRPVETR